MRRLKSRPGRRNRTGLDGVEAEAAALVGRGATETVKIGMMRSFLQVFRVVVAAVGVGLPEFDHRIAHGGGVAVENAAFDRDALAAGAGGDE